MATVAAAASPFAAPHEMMARPAAAAPEATMMDLGQLLRLTDFDKIANLGDGASGVVAKVLLRGCGSTSAPPPQ